VELLGLLQALTPRPPRSSASTVTIEDPTYYSQPWTNERTMTLSNGELLEYSCEENNKSLWEGRIKLWIPPNSSQPRSTPSFPDKK
jgi:hypothetical protein